MGAWRGTKKRVSDGRVDGRRKPVDVVIIRSHKGQVRSLAPSRPFPSSAARFLCRTCSSFGISASCSCLAST